MSNANDEIDPIKVRTGLFALITARLEDAHEIAVMGQSSKADGRDLLEYTSDLVSIFGEIQLILGAAQLAARTE